VNQVNIALIGTGRIGRLHARNLAYRVPGARLLAIVDVLPDAAQACASETQVGEVCSDYRAVLERRDVDAVAICASTNMHARIVQDAAAAGKHIFCEKPLDLDLGRIDAMLAAVQRAGVKLQVGFNRRFDVHFRRVRDIVASGEIGVPHVVRICSRDPAPPPLAYIKVSGGLFLDQTIHDFDMARFVIGREVRELYAAGEVLVDPAIGEAGDVDTAVVTLRYDGGAIGCIDNSRKAVYGYDQRLEVFGSRGVASAANPRPDTAEWSTADAVHSSMLGFFFIERYTDSYIAEMRAFVECIQQDKPPEVGGADGRAAVVLGYAAKKSLAENRPVRLEEVATPKE